MNEDAATNEQNAISEEYIDLIVENNDVLQGIIETNDGVIMGYPFENQMAIIYVNRAELANVAPLMNIATNLSSPLLYGIMDIDTLTASNITPMQNNPNLALRGEGVLIGIVDTGIDYTHPSFLYEDGTSKIQYIWDQTVHTGNPPNGFPYGTEYSNAQINAALQSDNPYDTVPSTDDNGHGTFLAGVACGREPGKYLGVAPDAEIVCVKLFPAKKYARENCMLFDDTVIAFQDTDVTMGIYYLMHKAEELKRPIAIILGIGTTQGTHDGTVYTGLTGRRAGMVLSSACGNEGNAMKHTFGELAQSGTQNTIEVNIAEGETGVMIYIWGYAPDKLSISLLSPSMEQIEKISVRNVQDQIYKLVFFNTTIWVSYFTALHSNGDQLTVIRLKNPEHGLWKITIYGDSVIDGRYHAWLPLSTWVKKETYFLNADPNYTITEIGNSEMVISVGAYNHVDQHIMTETGRGPSRHGILRPDILAPGVKVAGPLPNYRYGVESGTSIAAAQVAGAAALMLEWGIVHENYMSMNTNVVRSMLIAGADRRAGMSYPNTQTGYGTLDLLNTFKEISNVALRENYSFILTERLLVLPSSAQENTALAFPAAQTVLRPTSANDFKSVPAFLAQPQGGLEVRVLADSEHHLVSGAQIRIVNPKNQKTVANLQTDRSGKVKITTLDCPPSALSLYFQEQELPYALYDLEVFIQDILYAKVEGVQIFQDITALQNIHLASLSPPLVPERIEIPPHTLWGNYPAKIPESEVKVIEPNHTWGPLDQLTVPEGVIVHLGDPDDADAPNVIAAFKQYIKLVAAATVYPTWPASALQANILAILSFVYNRIYTQWYAQKGYPFTISASPQWDPSFFHRRNIYSNIDHIVENSVNTYVSKPGIAQPLLAQYCDGKKVNHPFWLSQWGSKDLGDEGYTSLHILQHYYGNNLFLSKTGSSMYPPPYGWLQ